MCGGVTLFVYLGEYGLPYLTAKAFRKSCAMHYSSAAQSQQIPSIACKSFVPYVFSEPFIYL